MRQFFINLSDLSESANEKLISLNVIPEDSWIYGIRSIYVYYCEIPQEWVIANEENKMSDNEFYDKVKDMVEDWLAKGTCFKID